MTRRRVLVLVALTAVAAGPPKPPVPPAGTSCVVHDDGVGAHAEILDAPGGTAVARVAARSSRPDAIGFGVTAGGGWLTASGPGLDVAGFVAPQGLYPRAPIVLDPGTVAFGVAKLRADRGAGDRLVVTLDEALPRGWTPGATPTATVACEALALRVVDPTEPTTGDPFRVLPGTIAVTDADGHALGTLEGHGVAWVAERHGTRARVRVEPDPEYGTSAVDGWIPADALGEPVEIGPDADVVGGSGGVIAHVATGGCREAVPLVVLGDDGAVRATLGVLGPGQAVARGERVGKFVEVSLPGSWLSAMNHATLAVPARDFERACGEAGKAVRTGP